MNHLFFFWRLAGCRHARLHLWLSQLRAFLGQIAALVGIIFLALPSTHGEETLYVATGTNGVAGNLYIVNPANAASTLVGPILQDFDSIGLTGLAFNPTTGELYGTSHPTTFIFENAFSANLITINLASPDSSIAHGGNGVGVEDIAFRSNGTLYGFESQNPFSLGTINLANGTVTTVGSSGLASVKGGGLAFNSAGTLYLAATGDHGTATLDTVNVTTGARTVGPVLAGSPINTTDSGITAMAFNSAGTLFAVDSSRVDSPAAANLVTVNPITGAITNKGVLPDDTDALAFSPATWTITAQQFDTAIPAGRQQGRVEIPFNRLPHSSSILLTINLAPTLPNDLKVTLSSRRQDDNTTLKLLAVLADHESFANNQPITTIKAVLPSSSDAEDGTNPAVYTYVVRVFDDVPKRPEPTPTPVGLVNSVALTLDPTNPTGHVGPPIVNIFAGSQNQPVTFPTQINFGDPLTVVATAVGNPSSFLIDRLMVRITEVTDATHPENDHISGIGPRLYQPTDVRGSTPSGATLVYTPGELLRGNTQPAILPPGIYTVEATAYDSAGFSTHITKTLTVARVFGFSGVTVNSRVINADSDCSTDQVCFANGSSYALPCNTATFNATLTLINNTNVASGNLRVRVFAVPDAAYADYVDPPQVPSQFELPPPPQSQPNPSPPQVTISTVLPVAAHGNELVQVSGITPKPNQPDCDFGIGFQIYARLEEFLGGEWIAVDSIKVTEGQWPIIGGFAGPGGGVNAPRTGVGSTNDPLVFDSLAIQGPDALPTGAQQTYAAIATATNTTTTQAVDITTQSQWSVNCPAGVFQAPNTPGQVQISAMSLVPNFVATANKTITIGSGITPTPTPSATPVVTLSASSTQVTEGGSITFSVSATPNTIRPVNVSFSITGKAAFGTDYTLSNNVGPGGQLVIPMGQDNFTVTLSALADHVLEKKKESVTIKLSKGAGYKLGSGKKAKITFVDSP